MTARQLHNLLRGVDDTRELVVHRTPDDDVLKAVWRAAQDEADQAYGEWRETGGTEAYVRYRACADRADAAMDALVAQPARARR
jgi:hypothetical protein